MEIYVFTYVGFLFGLILGFSLGFNKGLGTQSDVKEFMKKKYHVITNILE